MPEVRCLNLFLFRSFMRALSEPGIRNFLLPGLLLGSLGFASRQLGAQVTGYTSDFNNPVIVDHERSSTGRILADQSTETLSALDRSPLETAIGSAETLNAYLREGDGEGEVPAGSSAALNVHILSAKLVAALDLSELTQQKIDSTADALYDACVSYESKVRVRHIRTVDPRATRETKYLFDNLHGFAEDQLLFGMHDATGYGVGWNSDDDRSDVKTVCGSYPAVYSWDAHSFARRLDWERSAYRITSSYKRGGIQTICWHQYDPTDTHFYTSELQDARIVPKILPGGVYHTFYKNKLATMARYFKRLRGAHGESIPIIFRPYHEHDGGWFWWGEGHRTQDEYNRIWSFTVTYLIDSLNVHNLLYALSPSYPESIEAYDQISPGDDVIDIYGMDFYGSTDTARLIRRARSIVTMARDRNKVAAITEIGQENLLMKDWYTKVVLNPIKNDDLARFISYAAVWRNASETHHFAPYPGHASVPDFLDFFNDAFTWFEDDLPNMFELAANDTTPPRFNAIPDAPFTSFDPAVRIEIQTNERAFLRWGESDLPFTQLPNTFEEGEGGQEHVTTVPTEHGTSRSLYIHAEDYYGNQTHTALQLTFSVDTLAAPVSWKEARYDDSDWRLGQAPLGAGFDEKTGVESGHTAYFRKQILVDDVANVRFLSVKLKHDDGAAVFLNGEEIGRINLPEGSPDFETVAGKSEKGFEGFLLRDVDGIPLRTGANQIAVELHQADDGQQDAYFDLLLSVTHEDQSSDTLLFYGADWRFFDAGREPENQTIGEIMGDVPSDDDAAGVAVLDFVLFPGFPNPFNAETVFSYQLPGTSDVSLAIFDLLGRRVRVLTSRKQVGAGIHRVRWDGRNDWGQPVSGGVYLLRLITDQGFNAVQKVVYLK